MPVKQSSAELALGCEEGKMFNWQKGEHAAAWPGCVLNKHGGSEQRNLSPKQIDVPAVSDKCCRQTWCYSP